MSRIVILGDGLLGSELAHQTNWDVVSRKVNAFDLTDAITFDQLLETYDGMMQRAKYDIIINCIANTDTYSKDRQAHWDVNYKGVAELTDFCNYWGIKLVHISSDYVYANSTGVPTEEDIPVHQETYYAYTKLLADAYIELKSKDYLIVRATHKESPFKHEVAWINQLGSFDYVDQIVPLIIRLVNSGASGIYNVGTELKSMYDLAKRTAKGVRASLAPPLVPTNTQMNLDKFNSI